MKTIHAPFDADKALELFEAYKGNWRIDHFDVIRLRNMVMEYKQRMSSNATAHVRAVASNVEQIVGTRKE